MTRKKKIMDGKENDEKQETRTRRKSLCRGESGEMEGGTWLGFFV